MIFNNFLQCVGICDLTQGVRSTVNQSNVPLVSIIPVAMQKKTER